MKIGFSLSLKIIIVVVFVSLISTSLIFYLNISEQNKFFQKATLEKAIYLARALDAGIGTQEELKNKEKLQSHIYKHIWLNPDILKISINLPTQEGLKVAVSNDVTIIDNLSSLENQESYEKDRIISNLVQVDNVEALRVITPIHVAGQRVGTYEIILSLSSADKAINQEKRKLGIIMIGTSIFLILFLLVFLRKIVICPIRDLSKGMEVVRTGNLDYKVDITSKDEIGDLGNAFNKMTGDLSKYKKESERMTKELEQKVKERTAELEEMKEKYRNLAQSLSKIWLKTKKKNKRKNAGIKKR
jgi:methyl-accepting chemotaxis protein